MLQHHTKHWYSFLLNPWIILLSLILGGLMGAYFPMLSTKLAFIGNIYLSLLQMCIIPLVVTAIATSFTKLMHSKVESLLIRRMLIVFIVTIFFTSLVSIILGLLGNIGANLNEHSQNHLGALLIQADQISIKEHFSIQSIVNNVMSSNIFVAFVEGKNLSILVFAILFGIALGFITTTTGKTTLTVIDGLFHSFLNLVNGIMYLLPIGLFSLLANEIAHTGYQMFTIAAKLILYVYGIGIALVLLFALIIAKQTKMRYWQTLYHLREMMVIAFVSGSAFASLPFGITALTRDFKLSQINVNLFFPLSVCLNPAGTAYFLGLITIFIGHLYGQTFSFYELLFIWGFAVLTAIAISGMPIMAGFAFLSMIFVPLGLPTSTAIVLLIAISNIIDPIVTLVDVMGNAMTTTLLSKEKSLNAEIKELVS